MGPRSIPGNGWLSLSSNIHSEINSHVFKSGVLYRETCTIMLASFPGSPLAPTKKGGERGYNHMPQPPMYDLRTRLGHRLRHSPPAAQRTAR